MTETLRKWSTWGMALLALVIAVAAAANAAPGKVIIRKGDIAPGAVTSKALARGAVTANKIRKGAVTAPKLGKSSVTSEAIAGSAVTGPAIAPGSLEAGMLAPISVVAKAIPDPDQAPHNGEWTASNEEVAVCGAGEALLGGGFGFSGPSNGQSSLLKMLPVINGQAHGMVGQFMSDAGGAVSGEVLAICLK
jgi:hypothetical protein